MNLGKHLHTLLKRKAEVYVAGLGVFRRVYTPAAFDSKKSVFMPPVNYIEFDSLSTGGYDFITYLQQLNQIDRSEAEGLVQQGVEEIREELSISGEASLDSLGHLVSYGNTAVFKPLDLSGFNFEPIETTIKHDESVVVKGPVPAMEIGEEKMETMQAEDTAITVAGIEQNIGEEIPVVKTDPVADNIEEDDSPSGNRSSAYGLVAALAVLILGGLYYYTQYYNVGSATVTPKPSDTIRATVPLVSLDTSDTSDTDTASLELDTVPPVDLHTTRVDTAQVEDKKFTIVIGTHPTLAKAYEEAEAFHKDGHKSVRVITPNLAKNLKKVIWDTYATKAERDSALRYVQKHIKTDAWPDVLK
ncbi:MAG TPA: hypothetical protein PKA53_04425 [Sphingobacterium sp.]|nr:hypothetical protein [Sphingobacterium sp.]